MPEAEDVLIDAAERATTAARALWRRHRPPAAAVFPGVALEDVARRLSLLLTACFDREWPLVPTDAPPRATWLVRGLGNPAPWELSPVAAGFTDATQIFLPRRFHLPGPDAVSAEILRWLALSLGGRIAGGSIAVCPREPIARDLFWAGDGARIDRWLAEELPGLEPQLTHARRLAAEHRPALRSLTPAERAVEGVVRELLLGAVSVDGGVSGVAEWASTMSLQPRFASGSYRGVAPVAHWGVPRPDLASSSPLGALPEGPGERAKAPTRTRRLERRVEARDVSDDESDAKSGPFFVPFGDPPQTLQDPAGLRRPEDRDEDLDLEALAEEMERLGQLPRVRSASTVREVIEDASERPRTAKGAATTAFPDSGGLRYPEWEYRSGTYRPAYCVLREVPAASGDPGWSARVLAAHRVLLAVLRRRFERLRPRRECRPRQRDGYELDLDSVVEDFADRAAGNTPGERLYLAERDVRRDVAVALLVDASASTDAWVSGARSVLEVEKQATLVFCEALESLGDRYCVYAFSGRGARQVRLERAKGFVEPYTDAVRTRIAGLSSAAYTRLGAPIRHLTALLSRERSRIRLLFLLSDGKPNDEDEYEGRYGIEDTRQAVAEARLAGLGVFCLTIDRDASAYLPHLFGPHGHAVVREVADLPLRLPEIYRTLTERRG